MGASYFYAHQLRKLREELDTFEGTGATQEQLDAAVAAAVADMAIVPDLEQGVAKMLEGYIPTGWFWIITSQVIEGWDAPSFTTLDGIGNYVKFPASYGDFTGEPIVVNAPAINNYQQNLAGCPIYMSLPAGITGLDHQNGHMYLIATPDGQDFRRLDMLALRTGPEND